MDVVIAVLVLLLGGAAIVYVLARVADQGAAKQARSTTATHNAVPWTVGTVATVGNRRIGGGATRVVVHRVSAEGKLLDETVVAQIPDADPDWAAKVAQARAEAAMRAEMLNGKP